MLVNEVATLDETALDAEAEGVTRGIEVMGASGVRTVHFSLHFSQTFAWPAFLTDLRRETTDSGLSASLHGNFAP
ncbi:MAG TPA: hypothetical protein VNM92_15070 [Thermoanaerobaculia bacterium]|nr:hypothetical protein [Thermoanaerobaculia bacterium]